MSGGEIVKVLGRVAMGALHAPHTIGGMVTNAAAYTFVAIEDPALLAASVEDRARASGLKGSVLVAEEGINLFLAGSEAGVDAFFDWLRQAPRFAAIRVKLSCSKAQPFKRLRVKVKPEIISFRRKGSSPLQGRAPTVSPTTLSRWLDHGNDDDGRRLVLLDTRNREEFGYGTFSNALTLPIDNFADLPQALESHRESMADATVVSFCTGGIRCEKAALWMRESGMDNVVQLDGGILAYFEEVGAQGFEGRCFVFDERVALDPDLVPLVDRDGD